MIILIFEGLPGSGKTTLTKYLDKKYEFCRRIGEVIDKNGKEIPLKKHYGKNWKFFTKSDITKLNLPQKKGEKILLLDRGFPSTVSHGFTRRVLDKNLDIIGIIKNFKEKLGINGLKIFYIYLKNDPTTSLKRKKHKETDIWGKKKNLEATELFYETFFLLRENVFTLNVATLPLEKIKKKCEKIILELNENV